MAILRDYNRGDMDNLRSLKFSEFGAVEPLIVKEEGFSYNQLNARTTDLQRFAKLITSKQGLKFQGNQALLQQADQLGKLKKAATGGFKNLAKAVGKQAVKTVTNNVTTTASILAQVPVNGTGTHFIKGLAVSGYLRDGAPRETGLGNFLANQGIGGGVNGAKSALAGQIIPTNIEDTTEERLEGSNLDRPGVSDQTTYIGRQVVRNGGKYPESAPIGYDSVNTNQAAQNNSNFWTDGQKTAGRTQFSILDNDVLSIEENYGGKKNYNSSTNDTFKSSYDLNDQNYLKSPLYIQTRLRLGDQGNPNSLGIDEVNKLEASTESLLGSTATDIIPFEFNILEPGRERFLYFRAHLDSLNDNYTGEWDGTKYIGRAEKFYTYQGFDRTIDFSFKIAAFSKDELIPLYKKLNYLVGSTAPTYASNGEFMKGTLVSLTIGDYIGKQNGFISSIGLSWQTQYPWEIDLDELTLPIIPHILDVSVNFTPIHNFNVKSNITPGAENYIGGTNNFRPKVQTVPTQTRPITPLPTTGPTATNIGPQAPLTNNIRTQARPIAPIGPVAPQPGAFNAADLLG
jgi:hypothetical protein